MITVPLDSKTTFEEPDVVPPAAETIKVLVLLGAKAETTMRPVVSV